MEGANEALPVEIQTEILLLLPLKSLLQFMTVSKNWESIIRRKDFQHSYFLRSMTRPRMLFAFNLKLHKPIPDVLFHSVYQEEPLLSSGQQQMGFSSEPRYDKISAPIRGLVCVQSKTKVVLCNPGTRKILTLPELAPRKACSIRRTYFGYDEGTDVFKVLFSESFKTNGVRVMQHRVFTVRRGEESWKPIVCEHPYHPVTNALCIGGVLYFGARCRDTQPKHIVMSFNVRSEEFTVIELPEGVEVPSGTKLVKYNGEVCLVDGLGMDLYCNGELHICVRDESARNWRVERVVIPLWGDISQGMRLSFEGTIGTGELIFATSSLVDGSHFVVYYDTVTQNFRKFKIEGVDEGSCHFARTFLNHFDSLALT